MESRRGVPRAQWRAANCRKVFSGKSREIAASQVSSLEPLGPREILDSQFPARIADIIVAAGLPPPNFHEQVPIGALHSE